MADLPARDAMAAISAAGSTYTSIGGVKDCSLSGSVDKEDKTDHDSGTNKESAPGRSEFTMSISGNYDNADSGQALVRTAFFGKTIYYWRFRPSTATGAYEGFAQGYVTSYQAQAGNDGFVQFTAEVQLTGAITWQAQS